APPTATGSRKVLPATPPPRRRRAARVLSWIAVVTSVAVLATAGAGWALLNFWDGKISRIAGLDLGDDRPADLPRDAQNILIVGSDSRGQLEAGVGTQGTGDDFVTGQRADTVILAHLYGDADQAELVSFPRDSWVTIPAHTDPDTGELVEERESKLNSALFEGGPALLIETIEELSGLHVDHYMQIDFDGFQAVVDKLDGVEVCLPEAAKEKDSGIDLPAGRSVIQGDQALAFVRQRKGLPNGDIDRIRRQQQFIGAIVRKVLSARTLLNPVRLNGVITVATESLDVDEGTSIDDLQRFALRMRGFDAGGVVFTTVPIADINGVRQRQSVVLLDEEEGAELFSRIRRDVAPGVPEQPAESVDPAEPITVAPSSVRVRVYNGAGLTGLGRRAAGDLEEVGFLVVGAPEDRGSTATQTVVLHGPDRAASARTVAAAIPGATTRLDESLDRTLEVVVGSSYAGAQPVSVTGAAPEPTSAPSQAPVVTAASAPCAA
ncbi:MAG: LCP family protein, partial [Frankiaceae bacterium]|nr:LCP family protein [Frankiaceae bacterium]